MGSTFGNDVVIWQTESWWGGSMESNEEMAPLWSRTQYLELWDFFTYNFWYSVMLKKSEEKTLVLHLMQNLKNACLFISEDGWESSCIILNMHRKRYGVIRDVRLKKKNKRSVYGCSRKTVFNIVEHLITWVTVRKKWAFVCWNLSNLPTTGELCATITNITPLASKVGTKTTSSPVNGCAVPRYKIEVQSNHHQCLCSSSNYVDV